MSFLNRMYEKFVFFLHFFKNPVSLSTPMTTCRGVHRKVREEIERHEPKRVIELGSGVGFLSEEIFDALPEDGKLMCIERQEAFCERLNDRFRKKDGAVRVVHDDAMNLREIVGGTEWEEPDAIISTVPLIIDEADELCRQIRSVLPPDGLYLQMANLPGPMKKEFEIEESWFFLTNLPPERLHRAAPVPTEENEDT